MLRTTPTTKHSPPATRGLTLVEMLISMAVTLIMMAAVVNLFANIGAGVKTRNASMALGTQLRLARARLFKDLAGATSAVRPKLPSDDHDDGYLEIIEGQWSDKNPSLLTDGINDGDTSTNPELDYTVSIIPSGGDPSIISTAIAPPGAITNARGLGDYDDVLALTVRSESEPFVGRLAVWQDPDGTGFRWVVTTIKSDLAEIIWFAVENPVDGSNGEPGMRTVYRRVLLIAPWVDELPPEQSTSTPVKAISLDRVYYQLSDVSFRRVVNGAGNVMRVPNTLSDLTKRENRFGHFRNNFPHALELKPIRNDLLTTRNNFPEYFSGGLRPVMHPFGLPFEWDESEGFNEQTQIPTTPPGEDATTGNPTVGDDRKGEDVMLNDVLAFDLRVYDPGAPLYAQAATGTVLEPSDAGWSEVYDPEKTGTAGEFSDGLFNSMIGQGAYVDMGYVEAVSLTPVPPNAAFPAPQPTRPQFDGVPSLKSQLNFSAATFSIKSIAYDTWPYHYETDGINQDGDVDVNGNPLIDEGSDGLDTNNNNGVDDSFERETAPPYDTPLRGMQVKIRIYDRDSRQIREATVTRNFVPQ